MVEKQTVQVVTTDLTPRGTVFDQVLITFLSYCITLFFYLQWLDGVEQWFSPLLAILGTIATSLSVVKTIVRYRKRKQWEAAMEEMQEYIAKHSQENM